jgi:very-short-patch-repair endonuclease
LRLTVPSPNRERVAAKRPGEGSQQLQKEANSRYGFAVKSDPDSLRRARESRKNPTRAEEKLWSLLRNRRLIKRKFRRQHPIGPWVADFACPAIRLAIEVDGPSHDTPDQQAWDEMKTKYLRTSGWRVMRIKNADIYLAFGEVEAQIISAIGD